MVRCVFVYCKGRERIGKIILVSIKFIVEGYSLIMIEENEEEYVFNFDKNLYF